MLASKRFVRAAGTILGVDATPTFFINGKKYDGEMSFEAMDKIIAPIVNS